MRLSVASVGGSCGDDDDDPRRTSVDEQSTRHQTKMPWKKCLRRDDDDGDAYQKSPFDC